MRNTYSRVIMEYNHLLFHKHTCRFTYILTKDTLKYE